MAIKPYGSTSARDHGDPGSKTRPKTRTVDAHCHLHVQDAADLLKSKVDFVTQKAGGTGVMFEIAELILTSKNLWPYED